MSAIAAPSSPEPSQQNNGASSDEVASKGVVGRGAEWSEHSPSNSLSTSSRQRQAEAAQAAALKPSQQQQVQNQINDAQEHINAVLQSALLDAALKTSNGGGATAVEQQQQPSSQQPPRSQHHLNPNSAPYSSPNLYRPYQPNGSSNGVNSYQPYSPQRRSSLPSGSSNQNGTTYSAGGYEYYYPTSPDQSQSYSSVDSPRMGGASFNPYATVPAEGFEHFQNGGGVYGSPVSTSRGSIGGSNGLGVGAMPFNPYEQQQQQGGGRPYWMMGVPGSPAGGFSPQMGSNGELKNSSGAYLHSPMSSPVPHSSYPQNNNNGNGRFRNQFGQSNQSQIHFQQQQAGARLRGGGGAVRFGANGGRALGFGAGMNGNGNRMGGGDQHHASFHQQVPAVPRSPLLEEFRNNKSKKWEISDIADHVVEFSKDQHGSRFIQQKLESATDEERQQVFNEVVTDAFSIQTDVFGNYVIQKLFEFGDQEQKTGLAKTMEGNVLRLSLQTYGCRAIQKALEHVLDDQRATLVGELKGNILECVKSSNANHVVQRIVSLPSPGLDFVEAFKGQVFELSTHPYGCRVLQRCFEHLPEEQTRSLLDEMHNFTQNLVLDQFGNYVVQYVLEHGTDEDRRLVISKLRGQMLHLSRHKFASNVCEKAIITASPQDRRELIEEIMVPASILTLLKDAYGNYVLQRILRSVEPDQKAELVEMVKPLLVQMRKVSSSSYSKHLISVERLLVERPTPSSDPLIPSSLNSSLPPTPSNGSPSIATPPPSNAEEALVEGMGGLAVKGGKEISGIALVGA